MGKFESLQKIIQYRFRNIDILRGLIMVLMAIDHCYLTIYQTHFTESYDGALPNYGSMAVFLTRWVGNICAPGFALLMGMSISIFTAIKKKIIENQSITTQLFKRGVLLIIVQQLLNIPSLVFGINNLDNILVFRGGTLYALGFSMIIGALLIKLSKQRLLLLGCGVVFANYFISSYFLVHPNDNPFVHLLFTPGVNQWVSVNYPAFPWLGVSIIGMAMGGYLIEDKNRFINNTWKIGISLLLLFVLLRTLSWGDYNHIADTNSIINYFTIIKYPPSIAFIMITLGMLSLLFWLISKFESYSILNPLIVFGKVPLFFYFAHYYLYIVISKFTNHAISLSTMYVLWIFGLIVLYPVCKYYGQFKKQQSENSFWRLL